MFMDSSGKWNVLSKKIVQVFVFNVEKKECLGMSNNIKKSIYEIFFSNKFVEDISALSSGHHNKDCMWYMFSTGYFKQVDTTYLVLSPVGKLKQNIIKAGGGGFRLWESSQAFKYWGKISSKMP